MINHKKYKCEWFYKVGMQGPYFNCNVIGTSIVQAYDLSDIAYDYSDNKSVPVTTNTYP